MKIKWVLLDSSVWIIFQIYEFLNKMMTFFQLKPGTYQFSHWAYGRFLGLVALIAFLSYWYQADALIGDNGLSPWTKDLANIQNLVDQNPDLNKWTIRPTLLWFDWLSNHHLLFATGTLSAALLTIGIVPALCALISYTCYLSLMVVGEPFLSFQWDALLCEALLLSLPFLPLCKFHKFGTSYKTPVLARYLIICLLAKLMLESGIVKFTSFGENNQNTWSDLTALNFHYWTQPLPHGLSPWIDSLPAWLDQFSLIFMYATELILPIFLFFPGNLRRIALIGQILLQVIILASGNYGFFNLLTLCLCIPLIDDQWISRFFTNNSAQEPSENNNPLWNNSFGWFPAATLHWIVLYICWALFVPTTYGHFLRDLRGNSPKPLVDQQPPQWVNDFTLFVRPSHAFNSYGLFRVMTTTRPEIIIEGSLDGETWRPYSFLYKPTDPDETPRFAGVHMPRIDWQMWFEGLSYERYAKHSFSCMLYHKFLETSARGGGVEDFKNFGEVIGQVEYQQFIQSPPQVKQRILENYNSLLHAFSSRSLWFGNLLEAIFEHRKEVMVHLDESLEALPPPNHLRVSLAHYQFAPTEHNSSKTQIWEVTPIEGASLIISK